MIRKRTQKLYDHWLVRLIRETGDISIATARRAEVNGDWADPARLAGW